MLQKYVNGEPVEEYSQGELIDETVYDELSECNEGNANPDEQIDGYLYQWVTAEGEYVCDGTDKYTKEIQKVSTDGGISWQNTGKERQGILTEADSSDCEDAPEPAREYLTFEVVEAGTVTIKKSSSSNYRALSYSTDDGSTWTSLTTSTTAQQLGGELSAGDKVLVKSNLGDYTSSVQIVFGGTARINVYGNIMSMVYGDNFKNKTILPYNKIFGALFWNHTGILSAQNLVLPSDTLTNSCYFDMFKSCTNLTTAPELPATTLAYGCYEGMFKNCSSLVSAPSLPATTLAKSCYIFMFQNCTSLTRAPELTATTLADFCYATMFNGCTNLNYIKCLATDMSAENCTQYWVGNVAATGTFVKNSAATWNVTGEDGIPSGWTVENN